MSTGWIQSNRQGEPKVSSAGDEHGHDHPKHELSHYARRIYAIRDLLVEKGVISEKDIQCQIEYQEARSPANGAKLVARAWIDLGVQGALHRRSESGLRRNRH